MSSKETRSIIVAPGQGDTDAPIMAAGVDCNAKILTDFPSTLCHKWKITVYERRRPYTYSEQFSIQYFLDL